MSDQTSPAAEKSRIGPVMYMFMLRYFAKDDAPANDEQEVREVAP